MLQQALNGVWHRLPEATRLNSGNGAGQPARLHVAGQHGHQVAEWQVRITDAGEGVAVPGCYQQVRNLFRGPAPELSQQGRLAPARTTADKDRVAMSCKGIAQMGI